ncbi:major facilitator superfamily domain-containing protein [Bombardia bombarda]|uniref:Major facilitator superfamily domain-containing protein n=1 Tax=Bombardia bombarda TaxID=252184 RepID=A0AA40C9Y5_9PEZI|nr:major facilitator superfamily domain-containing protein [Bombardia bombarda]
MYICFRLKPTFLGFLAVFGLGNIISALAKSSNMVIAGRVVAGVGASGLTNGALVIMTTVTPPKFRPIATNLGLSVVSIGSIFGPLIGGALTQHAGWQWCFWAFLPPLAFVMLVASLLRIPDQCPKKPALQTILSLHTHLDLVGFAFFAPACILFLIAISWGGTTHPWGSDIVIAFLCGSVVLLGLLYAWCRSRGDDAILPPRLLAGRTLLVGSVVMGLQGGATVMMGYYLSTWFQAVKGAGPTAAGVMMLPSTVSQIVGSLVAGALVRKLHYLPPWAIVGSMLTAIGSGLMVTFDRQTSSARWIGYQIIAGLGRGVASSMPTLAAQDALSLPDFTIATATLALCQFFAGSVAISVGGAIFHNNLQPALARHAPGVDVSVVVNMGATHLGREVPAELLEGVLAAYNEALVKVFYVTAATATVAAVLSFWFSWDRIGLSDKMVMDEVQSAKEMELPSMCDIGRVNSNLDSGSVQVNHLGIRSRSRSKNRDRSRGGSTRERQ